MPHTDAKTMLAHALRDALQTVPLSKVTVSGLTRTAGVTRQAFYYHFADIRDLTVWVFKREVADQIITHASHEDWADGLLAMFVWMQNHPEETRSVVSSLGMEDLQIFLHSSCAPSWNPSSINTASICGSPKTIECSSPTTSLSPFSATSPSGSQPA